MKCLCFDHFSMGKMGGNSRSSQDTLTGGNLGESFLGGLRKSEKGNKKEDKSREDFHSIGI